MTLWTRTHRRGLTLLELVIVMAILIALAGLVVGLLPGMLGRAHTSTGASNLPELNKIFELHHNLYRSYPNGLDNLAVDTGLYNGLPGTGDPLGTPVPPSYLTTLTLNAGMVTALSRQGITEVATLVDLDEDHDDATYGCYGEGVIVPANHTDLATDTVIAKLGGTGGADQIEKFKGDTASADTHYILLGIGKATPLVGKDGMMQDAPVHFGAEAGTAPGEVYSRFAAVFELAGDGTNYECSFVTCVALHSNGIAVPSDPIQGFHQGDAHSHHH